MHKVQKKFMQGFVQFHILYHANDNEFYGSWMIEELKGHGYDLSPGTLYPLLHDMESSGLLNKNEKLEDGKIRKYYTITSQGKDVMNQVRHKIYEFVDEMEAKL